MTLTAEQLFTKLDQAGSSADVRPRVHDLFIDLPFRTAAFAERDGILADLCVALGQCQKYSLRAELRESWHEWSKRSRRARAVLLKGGPGQGKSTVGQYICQIHRAALILDDDGPRVTDTIASAARDVRTAAQRDEFWPTTPRIPIQIELKEFAHWFSQRKRGESRNVLAYIAQVVSAKTACEVPPKTIKLILGKKLWIVVFDGLDEVPHDVRDDVAKEVLYFLNDVLIEVDADVFSLCTSRPQGYSGQFATIDGPALDLAQLKPEIAIRCAEPVLRFGRGEEEGERSLLSLREAVRSPSVRELMTTPLQSHIMAVVVRDGGRPPERRWALFNSFYLVMKKRESLKNFQNPRVANLLRQEDRLLKSVHMRLGLVLHAQAERSAGAQTTLNRTEFEHLVRSVVQELDSEDIDGTVSAVMEATTERLVLVSTPESGEHVRFDIRQLQEFFAAEFLYSGVDSRELGRRIEVIGGDAHWREVMHFLMSALIENQRTTDIAVAVSVLRKWNEGDESGGFSLYPRRMARATLLATRLLAEGVLEQDKRDRQQLRSLFDPISGVLDTNTLMSVATLQPERSRSWLINVLLERVSAAGPSELIGGLFILGRLLPDEHHQRKLTCQTFKSMPLSFQRVLCELWGSSDLAASRFIGRSTPPFSLWVVSVAVQVLASEDWGKYGFATLNSLMQICRNDPGRVRRALEEQYSSPEVVASLLQCIDLEMERKAAQARETVDCGLIVASLYRENWINKKIPKQLVPIDGRALLPSVQGVFRLILASLWFAKERSEEALREVVRLIDIAGSENVEVLPGPILALIPVAPAYALRPFDVNYLRNADVAELGSAVDNCDMSESILPYATLTITPRVRAKASAKGGDASVVWRALALRTPRIAVQLAFQPEHVSRKMEVEYVPELIDAIAQMPALAAAHILQWGRLEAKAPDLLARLKSFCRNVDVNETGRWSYPGIPPLPIKLSMPDDADLLPVLAAAVLQHVRMNSELIKSERRQERDVAELLSKFNLTFERLRSIAQSTDFSTRARSGALALTWILAEAESSSNSRKLDLTLERTLYAGLATTESQWWLAGSLVSYLVTATTEADTDSVACVSYLLERCRDGNGPTKEVVGLITSWRERSLAPVSEKRVLDTWLKYDFQSQA